MKRGRSKAAPTLRGLRPLAAPQGGKPLSKTVNFLRAE